MRDEGDTLLDGVRKALLIDNPPTREERLEEMAKTTFATGATRSADAEDVRYDLIPTAPLNRLAARYAKGAVQHGDWNWTKGMPWGDVYNHLQRHLELWRDRMVALQLEQPGFDVDTFDLDDDLAAAAWGVFALMYFEDQYIENPEIYTARKP